MKNSCLESVTEYQCEKSFGNKVLHFGTQYKSFGKKSSKKVSGDSPTILRLYFSRTFFSGSSIILYKNVPVKSPLENAWEQSMFTTIHEEKSPRNIKLGLYFR